MSLGISQEQIDQLVAIGAQQVRELMDSSANSLVENIGRFANSAASNGFDKAAISPIIAALAQASRSH